MSSFRNRFQGLFRKLDPRKRAGIRESVHQRHAVAPKDLEEWLKAAEGDPRNAGGFFHHLLNSELFSVGRRIGGAISLAHYVDGGNEPFIPVFWHRDDVPRDLLDGVYRVAMPGRQLLELARGYGRIVLNPGKAPFRIFSAEEVEMILDRLLKDQAVKERIEPVGPAPLPQEVDPSADLFKFLK